MEFIPTQILVTASQDLEEQVAEELDDTSFPADPHELIKANTVPNPKDAQ